MLPRLGPAIAVLLALLCVPTPAAAQYFGRNKVQYRTFDFQVQKSEHFDLYYYPEEVQAADVVLRMAERWHARLSRFFGHDLRGRQAIILYAAASHFRQTNAVDGLIGEGTGGVTEGIKRRVVLPMSGSLADTDHVLGHELVHAFQFDLTGTDPRENLAGEMPGILAYPLWFAEGMAEYLSLGPIDTQTSMWMRDAVLREKLPHIKDLDSPEYFPYRWGHAFWAYVGARFGDRAVASLIRSAANPRFDLEGLARQLGSDPDTFTAEWHAAIQLSTRTTLDEMPSLTSTLTRVVGKEHGGRYNIGPRISPDGKSIAFFSEKDRFSVYLYVADAETGRIERRHTSAAADPHFDSIQFLNSAGAWSPDGRTFAITAARGGRPVMAFLRVGRGGLDREIRLNTLDDALNPVFAPDGTSVYFSGNGGGAIDLYRLTIATGALERLTADPYADLEPAVTPDGRGLVFSTERYSTNLDTLEPGPLRLAYLDLSTKEVRPIAGFLRGKHISPQLAADGRTVYFIADPDGVNNLYRISIDGGPIERLSSLATGIAGITSSSPALSLAPVSGRLALSVFEDDGHVVYRLDPSNVVAMVAPDASGLSALLPGRSVPGGDVLALLSDPVRGMPPLAAATPGEKYDKKLALDFLGQPTVSGSVSSFGTRVSGGISAVFSDMLGDRALGMQAQIGGTLADFGGQLMYLSRRHRWNWATSIHSLPASIGYIMRRDVPGTNDTQITQVIERQTVRGGALSAAYPFSASTRLEVSGSAQSFGFEREIRTATYQPNSRFPSEITHDKSPLGPALYLGQTSVALVRDSSFFGATAPVYGSRSRLEIGRTIGTVQYTSLLADWRRYYMPKRPLTLAVRALHLGRYGRHSQHDQLIDLFAGYPEFVHGYGGGSFAIADCLTGASSPECGLFRSLLGSRMLVTNFEVRAPLPGIFKGEIEYGRLPIDLVFFADGGVVWSASDRPWFAGGSRRPVRSAGGALRVNLFGLMAIEVAASHPFDRSDNGVRWQVGIRQGF
jgi:hypothetical protein